MGSARHDVNSFVCGEFGNQTDDPIRYLLCGVEGLRRGIGREKSRCSL